MDINSLKPARSGEVSTRLIILIAVAGVFIVATAPLGFYVWPTLKKHFSKPETRKLVYEENFENGIISEKWYLDIEIEEVCKIVDKPQRRKNKCLHCIMCIIPISFQ